ncbi:hypothetical protein SODG_004547 [Sodalis praecaptivus]
MFRKLLTIKEGTIRSSPVPGLPWLMNIRPMIEKQNPADVEQK